MCLWKDSSLLLNTFWVLGGGCVDSVEWLGSGSNCPFAKSHILKRFCGALLFTSSNCQKSDDFTVWECAIRESQPADLRFSFCRETREQCLERRSVSVTETASFEPVVCSVFGHCQTIWLTNNSTVLRLAVCHHSCMQTKSTDLICWITALIILTLLSLTEKTWFFLGNNTKQNAYPLLTT